MTRWERLVGLLLLLQSGAPAESGDATRPWLTAARAAEHFGVCRRTILRDFAALGTLGVPVLSRDGPRGGYALPPDYAPPTLPLTLRETLLLLLALTSIEKAGGTPYAEARASLVAKLRGMLSPSLLKGADALLAKVAFEVPDRSGRHPAPFLDALFAAAQAGHWIAAEYRGASGPARYALLPSRLSARNGFWYCEADAAIKAGADAPPAPRTFRLDRFASVTPLAEPPAEARLPAPKAVAPPYDDPSHPEVVVRLTARGVRRAETEPHLGHTVCPDGGPEGGGSMRFRCPPSELDWAARYFLGFGPDAEVLAPASLRRAIGESAREVFSFYAGR